MAEQLDTRSVFQQFVDDIMPQIREASSFVRDTIETEINDEGFEITISSLVNVLIHGRGPTRNSGGGSGPTLQQSILNWITAKGIQPRAGQGGKIPTPEQLSWAIATSIHRHGNKLYQQGGGANPFAGIITEQRLDALTSVLGDRYFNTLLNGIETKTD